MNEREAMTRAIELAWQGWGRVGANPMVGALVITGGRVLGEGWHAAFGGPHAEIVALDAAGARARGAELVVTLEPCAHRGKTPPCAPAIAAAGIRRVVFGARDVDPAARGGAEILRRAGLTVDGGVLESDVRAQNAAFFHRHAAGDRPYVALKLAVSLDGRIAGPDHRQQWLTGRVARDWVHWLRAGFDAVAVGLGTVKADDPQLTVRGQVQPAAPPLRVVFDTRAETPLDRVLVKTARETPTLVVTSPRADRKSVDNLRGFGVDTVSAGDLADALRLLRGRGVSSLLVEGGAVLAGRLVAAGLVDRLYLLSAPLLLGHDGLPAFGGFEGVPLEKAERWRLVGRKSLGDDTLTVLDR